MLFGVIHSAFQRSKKKSINVSTVALLSDNSFIARDDATTIRSIITSNGATIKESNPSLVMVQTREGNSIKIFLVGGLNPLVAAMEELAIEGKLSENEDKKLADVVDLTGGEAVVDLTKDDAHPSRAARAAKREAAKKVAEKEFEMKSKAKAASTKPPNNATAAQETLDQLFDGKLKPALKKPARKKEVAIVLEGDENHFETPPPKTVYRKTPVPKETSNKHPKKTKGKKKQAPDTPSVPPSPDIPSVVVVPDDDESTKLEVNDSNSNSSTSYQDFNGMGFTQEALVDVQQDTMAKTIDEFLAS